LIELLYSVHTLYTVQKLGRGARDLSLHKEFK